MQQLPFTSDDTVQYIAAKNVTFHHNKFYSLTTGYCQIANNTISIIQTPKIYFPQVNDVVLARVKEIYQNQYYLDINSLELIRMKLENINLPGLLRTVNSVDEANMRSFLKENELIIVQISDQNTAYTRNKNFRRCLNGFQFEFPFYIKKFKQNFFMKKFKNQQFQIFVGDNGRGWISPYIDSITDNSVVEITPQNQDEETRKILQQILQNIQEQIHSSKIDIDSLDIQ